MATDDAVTFTYSRENLLVSKATATFIGKTYKLGS